PIDGATVWIYDFGLEYGGDSEFQTDRIRQIFQEAFAQVWRGEAENDGFNRLVLGAALTWRELALRRAVAEDLRQVGSTFSQSYMEASLAGNARIARQLVELFNLRFDPARRSGDPEAKVREIEEALDSISSLDEDRILRSFLSVIQAMLRTN